MTEIEDRLHGDAVRWQHALDRRPTDVLRTPPQIARARQVSRWLMPLAAALIVVAVVLGASRLRHIGAGGQAVVPGTRSSGSAQPVLGSSTFDGFTFRHPSAWHAVAPQAVSRGPARVVGYLTDQSVVKQCSTSGPATTVLCHGPVTDLGPGGILVTVTEVDLVSGELRATRTIAGLPATVTRGAPTDCLPGATYQVKATVGFNQGNLRRQLKIVACASASITDPSRQEIDAMLDTVVYNDATAAKITGRFLRVGGPAPGSPVAVAGTVSVYRTSSRSGTPVTAVHTDSRGHFTTSVAPGTYYLGGTTGSVSGRGCASTGATVTSAGATTRTDVLCEIR